MAKRRRSSKSSISKRWPRFEIKDTRKLELVADFLIKFNLLAIPMYLILFYGIEFRPAQNILTDVVYTTFKSSGYWIERSDLKLMLIAPAEPPGPPRVETLVMGFDCTAWKTMYAFAALVIASPVAGKRNKLNFIIFGSILLFGLNILRLITTVLAAYTLGFESLNFMHTVFWREGLIMALIVLWFVWLKNQKNNISKSQTILRALYSNVTGVRRAGPGIKRRRVKSKKRDKRKRRVRGKR